MREFIISIDAEISGNKNNNSHMSNSGNQKAAEKAF